jgi:hypothetical protein
MHMTDGCKHIVYSSAAIVIVNNMAEITFSIFFFRINWLIDTASFMVDW